MTAYSVAIGRPIPALNKKPAAKCDMQPRAAVIDRKARYALRIEILAYPLHSTFPLGGSRRNIVMPLCTEQEVKVI